jgi:glycosyltransferase involved in cell wall biosynthesis
MAGVIRHQIETPLPLPAANGKVRLSGWCISAPSADPVKVKIAWEGGESYARRVARPDVGAAYGVSSEESPWGFQIDCDITPGAHLLRLTAQVGNSEVWHPLESIPVVVFSAALQAHIEYPLQNPITESVRVQGWCLHPQKSIRSVCLHYGTHRLACDHGLPRSDLTSAASGSPDVSNCGFIAVRNAKAGFGPLRIIATDETGTRHVFRTNHLVAINRDEENPSGLNLPPRLARIAPAKSAGEQTRLHTFSERGTARNLRILFVLYGDFTSNSALHVIGLANALAERGCECLIAVPENPETISLHHERRFAVAAFHDVSADGRVFSQGNKPDIIHAWTTRESVRQFCGPLAAATNAKLIVHLEDNEQRILETHMGASVSTLLEQTPEELRRGVGSNFSHPRLAGEFLRSSHGATVLVEKLGEFVPANRPVHLFWPAANASRFFPRKIPFELRDALGFGANHTVLFYHGNVHTANRGEVAELYGAVEKLNAEGCPTTLIRCGLDTVDFPTNAPWLLSLGQLRNSSIAPLMALADFFVQPGESDAFNDYRFPSKLPEFFSVGRPVILPRTNLGLAVRHLHDAFVLEKADASGIAGAIRTLIGDPHLRARLSEGAVAFAKTHFNWERAAEDLLEFYREVQSRV